MYLTSSQDKNYKSGIFEKKKKKWRVCKATSHLQSFYAMNRKAETQTEKMGDSQTSQHHLLCFGILCELLIRELVRLCMLISFIEM